MSKIIEYDSPIANIVWDEKGIFIFKLKNTSAIYGKEETKRQFDFFIKHSKGKPYKVIVDTRESLVFPTDDAFNYYFKHNKSINRTAIVANSLPMQLMIGHMLKREKVPNTATFKTIEEAIEWILKDS